MIQIKRNIMKANKINQSLCFVLCISLLFSNSIQAQETTSFILKNEQNILFFFIILTLVFILAIVAYMSYLLISTTKSYYRQMLIDKGIIQDVAPEHWTENIAQSLNQAVPIEEEYTIDLGHEYDGIRELDNRLPPWWLYMFYASIVWAVAYLFYYHVFEAAPLQIGEYKAEMALAEKNKAIFLEKFGAAVDENSVVLLEAAPDLKKGQQIYETNCVACHGSLGEGGVGPNLTDEYWVHGGGIKNIFKVIKYGVPEKGMIAWQAQLKPDEMQKVASYIMSLEGSNPPNAKAPQGDLYAE